MELLSMQQRSSRSEPAVSITRKEPAVIVDPPTAGMVTLRFNGIRRTPKPSTYGQSVVSVKMPLTTRVSDIGDNLLRQVTGKYLLRPRQHMSNLDPIQM
jgi:hypothetical protein